LYGFFVTRCFVETPVANYRLAKRAGHSGPAFLHLFPPQMFRWARNREEQCTFEPWGRSETSTRGRKITLARTGGRFVYPVKARQARRRASCCYTFLSADKCSDYEYCRPSGLHISPGLDRLIDRYQGDAEKRFPPFCLLSFRLPLIR
jgi:hypothetical protein